MKSINVYGTGDNALEFIITNKNNYIIKNVICNDMDNMETFAGIPVVKCSEAKEIFEVRYTIIASSESKYWDIKEKLERMFSLIEYEHFEYYETYQKKIAIIYGNCHVTPVKCALKKNRWFSAQYGFYPIPEIWRISMQEEGIERYFSRAFDKCALFIHQSIWNKNIYGLKYSSEYLIKKLKAECKIISMPNVYRAPRFLFPQMSSYDGIVLHEGRNYFPFRDDFIDSYYKSVPINELADAIEKDDTLFDATEINDKKDIFFETIESRQKDWDIKPLVFLKENIFQNQIFFDPNHPTNVFLEWVTSNILHMLNMPDLLKGGWDGIRMLDTYEIPIYYSVAKTLKMNFKIDEIRKSGFKLYSCYMNTNEYVKQYILWNEDENSHIVEQSGLPM